MLGLQAEPRIAGISSSVFSKWSNVFIQIISCVELNPRLCCIGFQHNSALLPDSPGKGEQSCLPALSLFIRFLQSDGRRIFFHRKIRRCILLFQYIIVVISAGLPDLDVL